jgi:hypothetical protein
MDYSFYVCSGYSSSLKCPSKDVKIFVLTNILTILLLFSIKNLVVLYEEDYHIGIK